MLLLHQLEFLSMGRAYGYDHASAVAQLLDQCAAHLTPLVSTVRAAYAKNGRAAAYS